MPERTAHLRSILHAATQVLRCDSVHLARLTEDRQALELSIAVSARVAPELQAVEQKLGFPVSGLVVNLSWRDSVVVRAFREQRLITTSDVTEIAGGVLPAEIVHAVRDMIGPRLFAVVPVLGRAGPLAVMLVERAGRRAFSSEERDLLLTYADRVGAELESEALADEALRLERLGQVAAPPPPALLCCSAGPAGGPPLCPDGTPLHLRLGAADAELLWSPEVRRHLQAGEAVSVSLIAHSGGEARPLRVTLRQEADGPLLCAVEDLGWSERLRRELLLAREHLSKVLHSVADAILTLDPAGAIQQANDASRTVLGLSPQQLVGRSVLELAATARGREHLQGLLTRLRRSGFAERQLRLLRRPPGQPEGDGAGPGHRAPRPSAAWALDASGAPAGGRKEGSFPAHLSALLLCDETLQPAGTVLRIHDQTERRRGDAERRRLRMRLLQTERLSALGEMAARIAHEVRNPLVSIGAAAQVVAEELPAESPVSGEVRAISNEVRRLDGIITDFLRFARPRREQAAATDVSAIVAEVVDLVRAKAGGLELRLLDPEPGAAGAGPLAQIDPDGLRQVLWNVLLNACEASLQKPGPAARQAGAELARLAAAGPGAEPAALPAPVRPPGVVECAVRLRPSPSGEARVLLTVADRGPGVPAGLRRRVFDPFFSTKARGTGLGLSICKQIVEEHGGRIRLLNRAGGGARVVIELRPASHPSLEHPDERTPHPDHR